MLIQCIFLFYSLPALVNFLKSKVIPLDNLRLDCCEIIVSYEMETNNSLKQIMTYRDPRLHLKSEIKSVVYFERDK